MVPSAAPPSAPARSAIVSEYSSTASATLSKSSWIAMKVGPRTFQWACFTCAWRSIEAARCRFSTATDFARMFLDKVLAVLYMIAIPLEVGWPRSLRSESGFNAERPRDAVAIGRIGFDAIRDMPLLNVPRRATDLPRGVV